MPTNEIEVMNNLDIDSFRDQPLWRYIDFPRLISLLHTKELVFIRPDLLGDPWEGYPGIRAIETALNQGAEESPSLQTIESIESPTLKHFFLPMKETRASFETKLKQYAVSCWHMQEGESAAMWDKYAGSGLVIQSSVGKLLDSLQSTGRKFLVGPVKYKNPEDPEWASFAPESLFQKREEYSHENEFRLVAPLSDMETQAVDECQMNGQGWSLLQVGDGTLGLCRSYFEVSKVNGVGVFKSGIPLPVDLGCLSGYYLYIADVTGLGCRSCERTA